VVKNGDVMQDAAIFYGEKSQEYSTIIKDLKLEEGKFVLTTCHRAENTDDKDRLTNIFAALDEINKDMQVVLPLHPRTKNYLAKFGIETAITLIDPVNYFDMIELLKACKMVATDSGGLQKEAFFFEKPCITMRDETEWVELIEGGFNTLAGADKQKILNAYTNCDSFTKNYSVDLYGKGKASERILEELLKF
jgi:UDP-GlcNAc3NAcA epimerase